LKSFAASPHLNIISLNIDSIFSYDFYPKFSPAGFPPFVYPGLFTGSIIEL